MKASQYNSKRIWFKNIILTIWIVIFITSCGVDSLNNSGIVKKVGELTFEIDYDPDNVRNGELEYFKIKLSHAGDEDIVRYLTQTSGLTQEEILYYFSYRLKDDIKLESNGNKSSNVLYHFERSYDLKKGRVFNVGFEPIDDQYKEATLMIDSELLNVGPVKIKFSKK